MWRMREESPTGKGNSSGRWRWGKSAQRMPQEIERIYIWAAPNYGSPRIYDLVVTRGQSAAELCLRIEPVQKDKVHIRIFEG